MIKRKIRLNVLIAGTLSVILLFILSFSSILTYRDFRTNIQERVLSSLDSVVSSNALSAADLVTRVQSCIDLFADSQGETLYALQYYQPKDLYKTYLHYRTIYSRLQHSILSMVSNVVPRSAILYIIDESMPLSHICMKGYPDYIFDQSFFTSSYTRISRNAYFTDEPFYQKALTAVDSPYWFSLPSQPNALFAAQSVKQTALNGYHFLDFDLGVIIIGFDVDWLITQLSSNDMLQDASILITSDESVIYSSDEAFLDLNISDLVGGDLPSGNHAHVTVNDKSSYFWSTSLSDSLNLITLVPSARIQNIVYKSLRLVILQQIAMLIVLLIAVIVLVNLTLNPINLLASHMNEHLLEKITPPPMAERTREMSQLYTSFNEQTDRISQLMDDIRAIEQEKRIQDIKLLQAQINPHFIYNTLDSISCMSLMAGNGEVADLLGDLAAILRYNLKNPDELVPLSTELATVKNYLAIQMVRCDNNLNISFEISDEALGCLVPKMSLQPLIENAIVHVRQTPCVQVSGSISDDKLTLIISSSNDMGDVELIMKHLAGDINLSSRSTGLGIRNVNQRIQMIYGSDYGLHYERHDDSLQAILNMPVRREILPNTNTFHL